MIGDFFASIVCFFLPYLTGRLFTKQWVSSFLFGSLSWFLIFAALGGLVSLIPSLNFQLLIRILAGFFLIVSLITIFLRREKKHPQQSMIKRMFGDTKEDRRERQILLSVILLMTVVYFTIWRGLTPYPFSLNWDTYEHITLAHVISQGHMSLLPSHLSDTFTFNGYTPLFHVLLSLPEVLFQRQLIGIYWWLSYWFYVGSIIGSYLLVRHYRGRGIEAYVTTVIAGFAFASTVVYLPLFLIPQNLSALLTIYLLASFPSLKRYEIAVGMLGIFMLHFVIGAVGCALILLFYLFFRLHLWEQKMFSPFRYIADPIHKAKLLTFLTWSLSLLLLLVLGTHFLGNIQLTNREEASHYLFHLTDLLKFITDWYGFFFFLFFPLGCIALWQAKQLGSYMVLISVLLLSSISFAPFSYMLKFFSLGWFFMNILLASGVVFLLSYIRHNLRAAVLSLLSILFLINFVANQAQYKDYLYRNGIQSHFSQSELDAARWLSTHVDSNAFLISDPATQYILEALSGVNSQGGTYMSLETRDRLSAIHNISNGKLISAQLSSIHDNVYFAETERAETYFVLSGRYFAWQDLPDAQKASYFYNVWVPTELHDKDLPYVRFLSRDGHFRVVYQNPELVILEVL